MKSLFKFFYLVIRFLFKCLVWPIKIVLHILLFPIAVVLKNFRKKEQESFPVITIEEPEEIEEIIELPSEPQEPIYRVGSIVPQEQDHNLRTFNIIDNEGEIYKINTDVEGKFYGPVWTKILACYESRKTLRARITKAVYDETDTQTGFQVRISDVTAFLPLGESLRSSEQKAVNTLVMISHIDPVKQKVIVSSKAAYESVFANASIIVLNEKTKGICWEYDDQNIYMLLPHKYMGTAKYEFTSIAELEEMMGKVMDTQVDSIKRKEKEALVTFITHEDVPILN